MATTVQEVRPPQLNSKSEQPPLFDGTIRLWGCYECPFAQRVWITKDYKGLQDKIKYIPIDLEDKPAWYKNVYPKNLVPSLEHNGKILGESLDLIKYVDKNFEGPSLFPDVPAKREVGEEWLSYTDTFVGRVHTAFKGDNTVKEAGAAFDYLENALHKFDDGPFFLGQFSLVDIAYIPFVERFENFLQAVWKYDITTGRPKLAAWIEEMNKIDVYNATKCDPQELVVFYKKRFLGQQ